MKINKKAMMVPFFTPILAMIIIIIVSIICLCTYKDYLEDMPKDDAQEEMVENETTYNLNSSYVI